MQISSLFLCNYFSIVYVLKGIYIYKFNLEGSLKGFKLSIETKKEKETPSSKK